ncbi:MAG: PTPDL family protein [Verrucomicrobiales bacterium]
MNTSRLLSIVTSLALACQFAGADTVKLKSGEMFKGTITAEDATSVTIEFAVKGTKGIKDERRFEKSEIESFQKDDPADKAWAELTKDIPTADLMTTSEYDVLSGKVDAFIAAHGRSTRAAEARRLLTSLKEERAQVVGGGMKLDGAWITPEQYQREKYWVDGRIALKQMSVLAKSGRKMEALRNFEKLEASHGGTTIHAKAITEAISILKAYGASLAEAIRTQPELMNQRAKVLTTLTAEERHKTEELQAAEVAAHKAKLEADRKSGTKWLAMASFDLDELKKAADLVDKEGKRLAIIETRDAAANDSALRQADQAINEGRIDAANALLAQFTGKAQSIPYVKELQARAKAEVDRAAAAAKKAADDARAATQRQNNPPPAPPRTNEEPDPVKEGMNPVAQAVVESDLGKRVAGETTPPSPTPTETTPTPPTPTETTPPSAVESQPSPAPTSTSTAEKEKSDPKEAAGKNFTPILYIVAGVLMLALIGLLILPKKKQPNEDTSVLEHRKKSPQAEELEQEQEEEQNPEDPNARG